MAKFAVFALASLMPVAALAQQTIVLKDGAHITGRLTGATGNSISFRDERGDIHRFDTDQVQSILFNNSAGAYGNSSNAAGNGQNYGNGPSDTRGYNTGSRDGVNREALAVPSGTEIAVRTNEEINEQQPTEGRTYPAQVSRDVMDPGGNVVIPRGSDADLVVRRVSDNNIALDLQSLTVNGQRYAVSSGAVTQRSGSRQGLGENRRTGEYVGGGAVLGTLLGAIAGGGKGAAIGAIAGGAAGAGAQVLTRGNQVKVPAETVLTFRLDEPITLSPVR